MPVSSEVHEACHVVKAGLRNVGGCVMYVRAPRVNLCRTGGFSACRTNHGCVLSPVLSVLRAAIPLTFLGTCLRVLDWR